MHLTAEQRAIGKQNFKTATEFTRRQFLGGSAAAAAVSAASLGGYYVAYDKVTSPVKVGVIGTGDEGSVLIGEHTPEYLKIVAISDIRPFNIKRAFHGDEKALAARPGLMRKYGWKTEEEAREHVKVYDKDYHDLLADPDVEAVIIALPLHLHATAAIEAMKAGKHVLTEKLMAHSVHECKEMARVAKQTGKILATGHQRHYSLLYADAVQTIKSGILGDLHHIRAQWHRAGDSWKFPLPKDMPKALAENEKKLEDELKKSPQDKKRIAALELNIRDAKDRMLDKDVDAKKYGYIGRELTDFDGSVYKYDELEELIRWRLFDRTGGGLMAELGSHQLDASSIFVSAMWQKAIDEQRKKNQEPLLTADEAAQIKVMPLSVTAIGGRHVFPYDRDVDDHVYCIYEFPAPGYYVDNDLAKKEVRDPSKKIVVTYSSISQNGFGNYGEIVMGTKGTLVLEMEQEAMLFVGNTTSNIKVTAAKDGAPVVAAESGAPAAAVATTGGGPAEKISRGYTEEMEHWAWCIRNPDTHGNQPRCHPKVAMADAVIALTTNMAIKENKQIEFKPEWFDIDSDETPEGKAPDDSRYT